MKTNNINVMANQNLHTKGKFMQSNFISSLINDEAGIQIAECYMKKGIRTKEEAEANAALIVSAVNNHVLLLRKLESLIYVLETERKQNGISLSDDYKTLYKESKQLLQKIESEKQ
jgi:hypothetical protein